MFQDDPVRPEEYRRFERPVPEWFRDAKLGIFVHWGPYSVPAWAEPIGELGTIEKRHWFAHNPYAEWYFNTIRIDGSPAAEHQREVYGGAPYDDFLDAWNPDLFDAQAVLDLFASTGARYFVPTTKHHDGVTLWDAPGTEGRNTVARGPRRDLVRDFAEATRNAGLRFGVYYSGGLDWHAEELPPITDDAQGHRPVDAAYAEYAAGHVADLIRRYRPDVLWGDIEWPDAGKPEGPFSLIGLLDAFYAAAPDGVVNDRWGETHWDFRTSEYQNGLGVEQSEMWENCRGIGYSFGYNRLEGPEHQLDGPAAVRHFVDVVSRGGNLLLNVGLTARGEVPELQRATLEHLAAWNAREGDAIFGSRPLDAGTAAPADPADPSWVRWTRPATGGAVAFVEPAAASGARRVLLTGVSPAVDADSARLADGSPVRVVRAGDSLEVLVPEPAVAGPVGIRFSQT